jgi:hypothetical protein
MVVLRRDLELSRQWRWAYNAARFESNAALRILEESSHHTEEDKLA